MSYFWSQMFAKFWIVSEKISIYLCLTCLMDSRLYTCWTQLFSLKYWAHFYVYQGHISLDLAGSVSSSHVGSVSRPYVMWLYYVRIKAICHVIMLCQYQGFIYSHVTLLGHYQGHMSCDYMLISRLYMSCDYFMSVSRQQACDHIGSVSRLYI